MPMPKALLCALGEYGGEHEEAKLRQAGFATATINWRELSAQPQDWMQLAEVLADTSVVCWVITGETAAFTPDVCAKVSLLTLAFRRKPPVSAFVHCDEAVLPPLPAPLAAVHAYHSLDPFAGKLMAARFKAEEPPCALPFFLAAHPDSLTGLWLEVSVPEGTMSPDYMIGVTDAEITAFGIGPRGVIPGKSTLCYPMLGIKGDLPDGDVSRPLSACASKDALDDNNACFCKIDGVPSAVLLGRYPAEDGAPEHNDEGVSIIRLA